MQTRERESVVRGGVGYGVEASEPSGMSPGTPRQYRKASIVSGLFAANVVRHRLTLFFALINEFGSLGIREDQLKLGQFGSSHFQIYII